MKRDGTEVSDLSRLPAKALARKVLVVDDESVIRLSLKKFLDDEGYLGLTASSGLKALKYIEEEDPEVTILDIHLPDSDGLALLSTIKAMKPETKVIIITGRADVRSAVDAMKAGALDYLEKPIDFISLKKLFLKIWANKSQLPHDGKIDDFVFQSQKMKEIYRIVESLATKSNVTVLVLGESGTGKNFLCKKIHELSPRKAKSFVEVGCSNIPEHLIESELFGYEKGAFTDAKAGKQGLVEMADGGTMFLDEIGDMPYTMQSKILTLIEEKRFRRLGGLIPLWADVRLLAATNRDLNHLVQEKKFRLDLYYRLSVATIEIPALRDREEDIPPLVHHFLDYYCRMYQCPIKEISPGAMARLRRYAWPGNVRELKNLIERLIILSNQEVIDVDHLPAEMLADTPTAIFADIPVAAEMGISAPPQDRHLNDLSLRSMEEEHIKKALQLAKGNQRKAAKLLNITRDTLRYRLKKLAIDSSSFKE